jgi:hypothetical protein
LGPAEKEDVFEVVGGLDLRRMDEEIVFEIICSKPEE